MSNYAKACELAEQAHKGQQYGGEPYIMHCAHVVSLMESYGVRNTALLAAGWLHDSLEDTDLGEHKIAAACGSDVARIVYACTGVGHNRKTRNACIEARIQEHPLASIVKVADRLANVRSCLQTNDSRMGMYLREWPQFLATVGWCLLEVNAGGVEMLVALAQGMVAIERVLRER